MQALELLDKNREELKAREFIGRLNGTGMHSHGREKDAAGGCARCRSCRGRYRDNRVKYDRNDF